MICPRCLKNIGTANGDIHTCSPTDFARNLETRVAELEAALNLSPCDRTKSRFDTCLNTATAPQFICARCQALK